MSDGGQSISIALCTWNSERFLSQQLESILAQSRLPDEMVVCDDGSRDRTPAILQEFARRASFPVRIFENQTTLGVTRNFEKAMSECRGSLIALCDHDDVWYPQKLEILELEMLRRSNIHVLWSNADLIDDEGNRLGRTLWPAVGFGRREQQQFLREGALSVLPFGNVVTGAALMLRSSFLPEVTPISPLWVHDGWMAFIAAVQDGLAFLDRCLMSYRVHARQQAGILDRFRPITNIYKITPATYLESSRQLQAMYDFLAVKRTTPRDILADLEAQAHHLLSRVQLPRRRLKRVKLLWREVDAYKRFSGGWISILKDFVR